MTKKVVMLIVALVVAATALFGVLLYQKVHSTPERTASTFMQDLANRDAARTHEQFSSNLQSHYQERAWQDYIKSLGAADPRVTPIVNTNTVINDRLNTYPKGSAHRFVYDIQVKGRQYRVTTVILKQDNAWKIDDFQGSYK